ncbi:MAG TPA: S8 family serine peptidase, partial [Candidatus Binatia bacterium]|nr:S8 family serine peptidase [Candidatus Binatia bacterium]
VSLVIGLSAAGPLLFIDPREMALALSFGLFSTLGLAIRAAGISLFFAWVLGAILVFWYRMRGRRSESGEVQARPAGWGALLLAFPAWLILILAFTFAGHPSFYGDRLFVIMRDQADTSQAESLSDVDERRRYVYETLVTHADATQEALRSDLSRWGIVYTPYYLVNGLEVEGGPIVRLWLQNRPEVDRVLYSPYLRPAPPEGTEPVSAEAPLTPPWNITMIGAEQVWDEFGARGAGVVVGQSDSGVQWDHPQLVDSYRGGANDHDYNWFDPWYHTRQPVDRGGHGTHTLGTVLGETTGVAPDATWFACANLARNVGSTAYYLDCMQFMLAPFPLDGDPFRDGDPSLGANVLNNSWGCPELEGCDQLALLPAVTALRHAGTFVVVSAGNDGPDCSTLDSPPAIYDQSLSVGAIDRFGNVTTFSSRGPVTLDGNSLLKPDLMAPGLDILSAYPDNRYRLWQGTSMAGPHVAGVVALMWSANPQLIGHVGATEEILLAAAQSPTSGESPCTAGGALPNNTYGYGIVNAYAAVQAALAPQAN